MKHQILPQIQGPADLKDLSAEQLDLLCAEIRETLIDTVSQTGGHLASNLGVVELTVALHKAFDAPKDKLIFDVGHQCYAHKLLTGRYDRFSTLRTEGGLSGFMRPDESAYDPFVTGHSSNSLSAALGIYQGEQIAKHETNYSVSVVGDGAMTGGLLFEAMNNAGSTKNTSLIVVLNDNKMSISRNVGSLARYLTVIRSRPGYHRFKHGLQRAISYIPLIGKLINRNLLRSKTMLKNAIYHSNIFEDLGFHYLGPVDGHDLRKLDQIIRIAKEQERPVLIHALTVKGKGYEFAEHAPGNYHGVSAFDVAHGADALPKADYSASVGDELCRLAQQDEKLCVITAAMTEGTGLTEFSKRFPHRFFDVGIAEEHATTFAAGLAMGGAHPVFCVYSSFLQRAYDQLIHDVAIAGLPVTVCVDRAGIVGEDGETHQGVFDLAFVKTIPGARIYAPASYLEVKMVLADALVAHSGPTIIRYPRGKQDPLPEDYVSLKEDFSFYGDCTAKTVVITFGRTFAAACKAYTKLHAEGIALAILKLNCVYPLTSAFFDALKPFDHILIFEEGIRSGGINESICAGLMTRGRNVSVSVTAITDEFIPHMKVEAALRRYQLDSDSIYRMVREGNEELHGK